MTVFSKVTSASCIGWYGSDRFIAITNGINITSAVQIIRTLQITRNIVNDNYNSIFVVLFVFFDFSTIYSGWKIFLPRIRNHRDTVDYPVIALAIEHYKCKLEENDLLSLVTYLS